jgi:hypothetical protein
VTPPVVPPTPPVVTPPPSEGTPTVLAPEVTDVSKPGGFTLVVNDGGVRMPTFQPVEEPAPVTAMPAPVTVAPVAAPFKPLPVPVYAPKQDRN